MKSETNQCIVCQQDLPSERHYAQLWHGKEAVLICCPLCLKEYNSNPDGFVAKREALQAIAQIQSSSKARR